MEKPEKCPKCGSEKVKKIFYGLPNPEFERSKESKKYYFAGCTMIGDGSDPAWTCLNFRCRHKWGKYGRNR